MAHIDDGMDEQYDRSTGVSEEMRLACEALCRLLDTSARDPEYSEPRYVISVASRMVGIEAHRLRHYERLGFVRPGRSGGNTRLYSQEDINQLTCVKTLINDLGLNSAGVQFALALMSRIDEMSRQLDVMSRRVGRLERRKQAAGASEDRLENSNQWQ